MHNDGTQGGPCQVFGRIGQKPWEEYSFQASADFSIVVGANRLGILVYIDFMVSSIKALSIVTTANSILIISALPQGLPLQLPIVVYLQPADSCVLAACR